MGEEGTKKNLANEQSHGSKTTSLSGPLGPIEIERGDPSGQPFGVSLIVLDDEDDDEKAEQKKKESTRSLHFSLYAPNAEKVQLVLYFDRDESKNDALTEPTIQIDMTRKEEEDDSEDDSEDDKKGIFTVQITKGVPLRGARYGYRVFGHNSK